MSVTRHGIIFWLVISIIRNTAGEGKGEAWTGKQAIVASTAPSLVTVTNAAQKTFTTETTQASIQSAVTTIKPNTPLQPQNIEQVTTILSPTVQTTTNIQATSTLVTTLSTTTAQTTTTTPTTTQTTKPTTTMQTTTITPTTTTQTTTTPPTTTPITTTQATTIMPTIITQNTMTPPITTPTTTAQTTTTTPTTTTQTTTTPPTTTTQTTTTTPTTTTQTTTTPTTTTPTTTAKTTTTTIQTTTTPPTTTPITTTQATTTTLTTITQTTTTPPTTTPTTTTQITTTPPTTTPNTSSLGTITLPTTTTQATTILHTTITPITSTQTLTTTRTARITATSQPTTVSRKACAPKNYSYWGENGPSSWPNLFGKASGGTCDSAVQQSPVALSYESSSYLPLLHGSSISFAQVPGSSSLSIRNDANTVQLKFTGAAVWLSGMALDGKYRLDHVVAHWGATDATGSEHTLDGTTFPAELQLVFHKESYSSLQAALKGPDTSVVILAVFLTVREFNQKLEVWMKHLENVTECGAEVEVDAGHVHPWDLLPAADCYYRYAGSLSAPDCTEAVTWSVFAEPISVSARQMSRLRDLKYAVAAGGGGKMVNNMRPLQKLAGRTVFRSFNNTVSSCAGLVGSGSGLGKRSGSNPSGGEAAVRKDSAVASSSSPLSIVFSLFGVTLYALAPHM